MQQRTTSPLHMRIVLERLDAQERLSDTPTQEIPAIRLSQQEPPRPNYRPRPMLPRDRLGRPYVCITNEQAYTLDLVLAAVQRYVEVQGYYPTVIFLSAYRFFSYGMGMQCYYPHDSKPIPYGYEIGNPYDVVARGEFDGN